MADSSMLHVNKELKIAVWPSAQSINLPIQAFFLDGGLKLSTGLQEGSRKIYADRKAYFTTEFSGQSKIFIYTQGSEMISSFP